MSSVAKKEIKSMGFIHNLHKVLACRLTSRSFDNFYINFYRTFAYLCRKEYRNDGMIFCSSLKNQEEKKEEKKAGKEKQNVKSDSDYNKLIRVSFICSFEFGK